MGPADDQSVVSERMDGIYRFGSCSVHDPSNVRIRYSAHAVKNDRNLGTIWILIWLRKTMPNVQPRMGSNAKSCAINMTIVLGKKYRSTKTEATAYGIAHR